MKRWTLASVGVVVLATGLADAQGASRQVRLWLVNPQGEVDGVQLTDGGSVYFPPEVGRTLVLSVRIGDPVRVEVVGGRRYLVDERDDMRVDITWVSRGGGPVVQPALQWLTARGHVSAFIRRAEGGIQGFVLNTGEQVRIPPVLGPRLLSVVRLGDLVTVRGLGRRGAYGVGMMARVVTTARGEVVVPR